MAACKLISLRGEHEQHFNDFVRFQRNAVCSTSRGENSISFSGFFAATKPIFENAMEARLRENDAELRYTSVLTAKKMKIEFLTEAQHSGSPDTPAQPDSPIRCRFTVPDKRKKKNVYEDRICLLDREMLASVLRATKGPGPVLLPSLAALCKRPSVLWSLYHLVVNNNNDAVDGRYSEDDDNAAVEERLVRQVETLSSSTSATTGKRDATTVATESQNGHKRQRV